MSPLWSAMSNNYFLVVKSVSNSEGLNFPSVAFSQVQASRLSITRVSHTLDHFRRHHPNLFPSFTCCLFPRHTTTTQWQLDKWEINIPAGRTPQAQAVTPTAMGFVFSVAARSQVHSPAGRARHEQRGPETKFSVAAFSQVQWRADCLPHEHVACFAVEQEKGEGTSCVSGKLKTRAGRHAV